MLLNKKAFEKIFQIPIKEANQEGRPARPVGSTKGRPARPAGATMNAILKTIKQLTVSTQKGICICSGYKKDTVNRAVYWLKHDKEIKSNSMIDEKGYGIEVYSVKGLS